MRLLSRRILAVGLAVTVAIGVNPSPGATAQASPEAAVQWGAASDLSVPGIESCQPEVAASADGKTLTVTWFGYDDALQGWVVQARRFAGGGWGPVQTLSDSVDEEGVCGPRVVSSADGTNATVVWSTLVSGEDVLRVSRYESGSWSAPQTLPGSGGEEPPQFAIASSTDGHKVTVVWANPLVGSPGNDVVRISRYRSGSGWGSPQLLSESAQDTRQPQVASSSDGETLTVAWANYSTPNDEVQVRRYRAGSWNTAQTVSDPALSADLPQVAQAADGSNATVVWRRTDTSGIFTVQTSRYQAGVWSPIHDLAVTGSGAGIPLVKSSADGATATALWTTNDTDFGVQARRFQAGSWGAAQQLAAPGEDAVDPQLVSSADGQRVTAIWSRASGTDMIVQVRTLQSGEWGRVHDLSGAGDLAQSVQVASSSDGRRITAVWSIVRDNDPDAVVQGAFGVIPIPPPDAAGTVTGVKFLSTRHVRVDLEPAAGITGIQYRTKPAGNAGYSDWKSSAETAHPKIPVRLRKGTWIQLRGVSEGGPSVQSTELFVRLTGGKLAVSRGDVTRCSQARIRAIRYTAKRQAKVKLAAPAARCVSWRHTKANRAGWAAWRPAVSKTLTTPKLGKSTGKIQIRAGKRTATVWTYYPSTAVRP